MASFNFNQVTLGGRLTSDAELKQTQSGISVTEFGIAVNRRPSKAGAEQQTDFINCQAWRGTAEFISKYFHKGNSICITGEIHTDSYTDKDGNKRRKVFIMVSNAYFVDSAGNGSTTETTTANSTVSADLAFSPAAGSNFEPVSDEDMPF